MSTIYSKQCPLKARQLKRLLIAFLKKEGVFCKYITYAFGERGPSFLRDSRISIAFDAFIWERTDEGWWFWNRLFYKWRKIISNLDNKQSCSKTEKTSSHFLKARTASTTI